KTVTTIRDRKPVSSKRWIYRESDGTVRRYEETVFANVELDDDGNLSDADITTSVYTDDSAQKKLKEKTVTSIRDRKPVSSKRWVYREADGTVRRYEETVFANVELDDDGNLSDADIVTNVYTDDSAQKKL